jgi:hypothetical protein
MNMKSSDLSSISGRLSNLSFVCACLVVAIHTPSDKTLLIERTASALTASFFSFAAVPFFFLCSGFYLSRHMDESGWWRKALCSRIWTLVVPYLFWCLLYQKLFLGELDLSGLFDPLSYPSLSPFWYVRTLYFLVFASPVLFFLFAHTGYPMLVLLFLVYCFYFSLSSFLKFDVVASGGHPAFLFYGGLLSLEGLFYFSLGLTTDLAGIIGYLDSLLRRKRSFLYLLLSVVVLLFFLRVGLPGRFNGLLRPFIVVPVLVVLVLFVSRSSWPRWIVRSSFLLFATHTFVLKSLAHFGIRGFFVSMFACVAVGIVTAFLIRRLPPFVGRVLAGGRC